MNLNSPYPEETPTAPFTGDTIILTAAFSLLSSPDSPERYAAYFAAFRVSDAPFRPGALAVNVIVPGVSPACTTAMHSP